MELCSNFVMMKFEGDERKEMRRGMRDEIYPRALGISLAVYAVRQPQLKEAEYSWQSYVSVKQEWLGNPAVMHLSPAVVWGPIMLGRSPLRNSGEGGRTN